MPQIVVTDADRRHLELLLASEFAKAIGPRVHLDELSQELANARIVAPEEVPEDVVTMNSRVVVHDVDTEEDEMYTLVYPGDADIASGRLSILAPIGTAILGQRVNDVVKWRVPGGMRRLRIAAVLYQPEAELASQPG
jgi:regulator of nucleoside diphosphate kinase